MKFPRNARIARGQLDVAPFAAVFFLLVIFMMLGSLVYTPGARLQLQLPRADGLAGTDKPTVSVAIDVDGRLYYENQWIDEAKLQVRLREAVRKSTEPLTLIVKAHKSVSLETSLRLAVLARDAGISEALLATLPRDSAAPASRSRP
jgi:biopolymer transport protein ExbD